MTVTPPLNPPTSQLPPIAKIKAVSLQDVTNAIGYLRLLYNPEVRGTRRLDRKVVFTANHIATEPTQAFNEAQEPIVKHTSSISFDLSLDALRADEFERAYAIRWMTALIARADTLAAREASSLAGDSASSDAYEDAWENAIQDVAALLAVCAGTASAGLVSRSFTFRQKSGREVKVQITDVPLENQDYSSVGAQTWGSACLLAEMIVDNPAAFSLDPARRSKDMTIVLELGAGTGLVSLTIWGLLKGYAEGNPNGCYNSSVVATDFHPSVLQNLQSNIAFNTATSSESSPVSISAHHLDWSDLPSPQYIHPFEQPFDLIFGADVVYEIEHAKWIKSCVERFLRKPISGELVPQFHLMIPLRPTHAAESQTVEKVFPFAPESTAGPILLTASTLGIISKEIILCDMQEGLRSRAAAGNLVEYVHYTIAWI